MLRMHLVLAQGLPLVRRRSGKGKARAINPRGMSESLGRMTVRDTAPTACRVWRWIEGTRCATRIGRSLLLCFAAVAIPDAAVQQFVTDDAAIGFRATIVPDRLLMDPSYGAGTVVGVRGAGFTVGLARTPPPFRRP
jgi:hypothetical protein